MRTVRSTTSWPLPALAPVTHPVARSGARQSRARWAAAAALLVAALGVGMNGPAAAARDLPSGSAVASGQRLESAAPWGTLSAGHFLHTCGVRTDGTAWCWGYDVWGQVDGAPSEASRPSPVQFGSDADWTVVVSASSASCGLKSDATAWCWGEVQGQMGGAGDWRTLTAYGTVCGTKTDGTAWCWDDAAAPKPRQIGTGTRWVSLATGLAHICGIKKSGTLWCWGENKSGQLGDGTWTAHEKPRQVGTSRNWASVTAGRRHTCGVRTNGAAWCWGNNSSGQVGDGTTKNRKRPYRVGTEGSWVSLSAGEAHTCGVKADGSGWCWGDDSWHQLGDGMTTNRSTPQRVGGTATWSGLTAGAAHTCGVKADGSAWCWGRNVEGEVGDGTTTPRSRPVPVLEAP